MFCNQGQSLWIKAEASEPGDQCNRRVHDLGDVAGNTSRPAVVHKFSYKAARP